jgi:hypothetical protein
MKTHPEFIEFKPAFRRIATALIAALLIALYSGCTPQTAGPSLTPAIPNAREPITFVISQSGVILSATDASGVQLSKQNDITQGEKHYLFITGMTIDPSAPNQAVCLFEDRQGQQIPVGCWPNNTTASVRVNSQGIQDVHYDGSSQLGKPPVGSQPLPPPLAEYWFRRQPQQPGLAAVGPLCVQKCFDGYCWCG